MPETRESIATVEQVPSQERRDNEIERAVLRAAYIKDALEIIKKDPRATLEAIGNQLETLFADSATDQFSNSFLKSVQDAKDPVVSSADLVMEKTGIDLFSSDLTLDQMRKAGDVILPLVQGAHALRSKCLVYASPLAVKFAFEDPRDNPRQTYTYDYVNVGGKLTPVIYLDGSRSTSPFEVASREERHEEGHAILSTIDVALKDVGDSESIFRFGEKVDKQELLAELIAISNGAGVDPKVLVCGSLGRLSEKLEKLKTVADKMKRDYAGGKVLVENVGKLFDVYGEQSLGELVPIPEVLIARKELVGYVLAQQDPKHLDDYVDLFYQEALCLRKVLTVYNKVRASLPPEGQDLNQVFGVTGPHPEHQSFYKFAERGVKRLQGWGINVEDEIKKVFAAEGVNQKLIQEQLVLNERNIARSRPELFGVSQDYEQLVVSLKAVSSTFLARAQEIREIYRLDEDDDIFAEEKDYLRVNDKLVRIERCGKDSFYLLVYSIGNDDQLNLVQYYFEEGSIAITPFTSIKDRLISDDESAITVNFESPPSERVVDNGMLGLAVRSIQELVATTENNEAIKVTTVTRKIPAILQQPPI